ncbi:hypothetical protein ID263_004926 [Escherichia coli]|uniref:hypothetical protein n=1 Tax=Escherichia coli TaxID=562 RepID=UPI001818F518|nr:hypothetical protein [Escherichia coli]EFE6858574.1 hypothetical protein [Escherichia coli]EFO0741042.1 hypothetical protein [Escherichia coli]EGH0606633.1 hypothetical protein [Escherichia coli]EHB0476584.1 hypothetical protein [Escherichia coli]
MNKNIIILITLLTGCSAGHWHKPGATESEMDNARADCQLQAYEKYPVDIKQTFDLDIKSFQKNSPTNALKIKETDKNQQARNAFYKSCMYKKGWHFVK